MVMRKIGTKLPSPQSENKMTTYQSRYPEIRLTTGQTYFDNRYEDFYSILDITPCEEGCDVIVTVSYTKRGEVKESGDFIAYHINANMHTLKK
jgi:hypothetical protein